MTSNPIITLRKCKRLIVGVDFVGELIELLDKRNILQNVQLRRPDNRIRQNIYGNIADLMFEIIFAASSIKEPPDKCWTIQYNIVWNKFFNFSKNGKAVKIMQFRLRRLLYDEIKNLEKIPNYKSSKILGFCLNIMGLSLRDTSSGDLGKNIMPCIRQFWLGYKRITSNL